MILTAILNAILAIGVIVMVVTPLVVGDPHPAPRPPAPGGRRQRQRTYDPESRPAACAARALQARGPARLTRSSSLTRSSRLSRRCGARASPR